MSFRQRVTGNQQDKYLSFCPVWNEKCPGARGTMKTGDDRTRDFISSFLIPQSLIRVHRKKGRGYDYCDSPGIGSPTCTSFGRHSLMIFLILTATQFPGNNPDRTIIFEIPCTVLSTTGEVNDHPLVIDHCPEFYRAAFL
jgi:hypothetical protein